jgi:hypothetical protein
MSIRWQSMLFHRAAAAPPRLEILRDVQGRETLFTGWSDDVASEAEVDWTRASGGSLISTIRMHVSPSEMVPLRVIKYPECFAEVFDLGFVDVHVSIAIVNGIIDRFWGLAGDKMVLADFMGGSMEQVDWRVYFEDPKGVLPVGIPNAVDPCVLGMSKTRFQPIKHRFADYKMESFDSFVVAKRNLDVDFWM